MPLRAKPKECKEITVMKKIICSIVLILATMLCLVGCGKFTCELCGEEKSGKQYKDELFGEEIVYCSDCHEELEELEEGLDELF